MANSTGAGNIKQHREQAHREQAHREQAHHGSTRAT